MELYLRVRLAVSEGMTKRQAAKHFNISRDSVAKMVAYQSHDITCMTSGNVMLQIDAWSEQRNLSEIRRLAEAIRAALRDWEPTLAVNALVTLDHWRTDYINEGAIQHASIRYNAIVEQPSATAHY